MRAFITDAFVPIVPNCSKHDVTMVSDSQATVRSVTITAAPMCNISSQGGGNTTLLLLTVITKVLDECIIEPA